MKEKTPKISMRLPGKRSQKLIDFDEKYVSQSYTRAYPTVIERGEGALIWDVDGNRFIDFHSGIGVCSTGNCHPSVVAAIKEQAEKAVHIASADFYHEPVGKLAKKMCEISPTKAPNRVFFANSGAEAVEAGIKLARYKRRVPGMIAFLGSFHGRTMGALSLTSSKVVQRARFLPLLPQVFHIPYAYCYRCPYHLKYPACDFHCVNVLEDVYFKKLFSPEDIAALIVEPIQGEGGYLVPPDGYHKRLKSICEKYGILYMADEVQSGMGKTGKMFAIEHWNVVPDIIVTAKGIASGMPLGACISSQKLMDWERGAHSTTFGGNPISCAASLATVKLLEDGLIVNADKVGKFIIKELKAMMNRHWSIGDVRGKGLMIGIEFVLDKKKKTPAPEMAAMIEKECFNSGLMLLTCGPNSVRMVPPLVIDTELAGNALEIFEKVVAKVEKHFKKK